MIYKPQVIECPDCGSPIYFDVNQLIQGVSFKCSNCKSSISLLSSSTNIVKETISKFEELNKNINK